MSLRKNYKTDAKAEVEGVWEKVGYNDFLKTPIEILITRAGPTNPQFTKVMEEVYGPVQDRLMNDALSSEEIQILNRTVFIKANIKCWRGVSLFDLTGEEKDQGTSLEFTEENCFKLFAEMPDLFKDWEARTEKRSTFLEKAKEKAAKN